MNKRGNNGNHGVKGRSGRKTLRQEHKEFELLYSAFFEPVDRDELETKIRSKKSCLLDTLILKALSGNDRCLIAIFNKIFPDNLRIQGLPDQKRLADVERNIRAILDGIPKPKCKVRLAK